MLNKIKFGRKKIIILLMLIGLSFFNDRLIYKFNEFSTAGYKNYYIVKGIYFLCVLIVINLISEFYKKYKNELLLKRTILFMFLFCLGMFLILFIIWPGVWLWDNMEMLDMISRMELSGWHGLLMHIFFGISLMIIPIPVGIIIIQILVLGIIASRIFWLVGRRLNKSNYTFLLLLFFFFPVNIYWTICPYRTAMFGYLTGLYIMETINILKQDKINKYYLLYYAILGGSIWVIRSEGIALLLLGVLMSFKILKKCNIRYTLFYFCVLLLVAICIKIPHKSDRGYLVTSILNPLQCLMKIELYSDNLNRDLNNIDRVFDITVLKRSVASPIRSNLPESAYSQPGFLDNIYCDSKTFNTMVKSYINLVLFNNISFLKFRTITFIYSMQADYSLADIANFDLQNNCDFKFNEYRFSKPIFNQIRNKFIDLIMFKNSNNLFQIIGRGLNNMILPIFICIFLFLYGLYNKKIQYWLPAFVLIMMGGIVFISAPASNTMYYYSIYYTIYLWMSIEFITYLETKNLKKEISL